MKPYQSPRQRPVHVTVAAEPRRAGTVDRIALVSLLVAALATIASIIQLAMSYDAVDTPYATLVYSEQVKRSVEAVDFMTTLRTDVERWEAMYQADSMDVAATLPEVQARIVKFAELSQGTWLLTKSSQDAIGRAAQDFSAFAVYCLRPRYSGEPPRISNCPAMFSRHEASLELAKSEVLGDIRFEYRNIHGVRRRLQR